MEHDPRSPGCPGRKPSRRPSTSAAPVPPHPTPTCSGDTRTRPAGIVDPPLLPVDSSRPFGRFDLRLSVFPTSSLRHWLSGSSPSALAAESNSRTTSDSRFCKGSFSSPSQTPRSIAYPGLLPLCCSLPLNRLPRLPIAKYKTALLHPSGSSPRGLTRPMSPHYTHPLRSIGFHRLLRYYGVFRPLAPHSYSRPCGSCHLWLLR